MSSSHEHQIPDPIAFRPASFAKRHDVSTDTVRRWIRSGRIRTVKIEGVVLIPATESERLLAGARVSPDGGKERCA